MRVLMLGVAKNALNWNSISLVQMHEVAHFLHEKVEDYKL